MSERQEKTKKTKPIKQSNTNKTQQPKNLYKQSTHIKKSLRLCECATSPPADRTAQHARRACQLTQQASPQELEFMILFSPALFPPETEDWDNPGDLWQSLLYKNG